jgi:ribonuclease T1
MVGRGGIKTVAWVLRLGFIVALVLAVWMSRPEPGPVPESPTTTPPAVGQADHPPTSATRDSTVDATLDATEPDADLDRTRWDDHPVASTADGNRRADADSERPALAPDPSIDPELQATLSRIATGGPYPYRQDDTVFLNREGRLPKKRLGYYREYTVDTPGAGDRGPRRIVRGEAGELYFTKDHYQTFVPLDNPPPFDDRSRRDRRDPSEGRNR